MQAVFQIVVEVLLGFQHQAFQPFCQAFQTLFEILLPPGQLIHMLAGRSQLKAAFLRLPLQFPCLVTGQCQPGFRIQPRQPDLFQLAVQFFQRHGGLLGRQFGVVDGLPLVGFVFLQALLLRLDRGRPGLALFALLLQP